MRRARRSILRNTAGATAVEFALIAPFLFIMLFVIFQTALLFVAEQVLDNGVANAARLIRTGQTTSGTGKTLVCNQISYFLSCTGDNFFVDVQSNSTITSLTNSAAVNSDGTYKIAASSSYGSGGDYVLLRAYYQWPLVKVFGTLTLANLTNGKRLMTSYAVFRNEPSS